VSLNQTAYNISAVKALTFVFKRPTFTSELFTKSWLRMGKNSGTLSESDRQVGLRGNRNNMMFYENTVLVSLGVNREN
jgi:hypothetical protein